MRRKPFPMQNLVEFQESISLGSNGHGGEDCEWQTQFKAYAHLELQEGSEEFEYGRIAGKIPAVLTMRNSANARLIDRTWRICHRGQFYSVAEQPRLSPMRDQFIMKLEGIN